MKQVLREEELFRALRRRDLEAKVYRLEHLGELQAGGQGRKGR